jgi:hypothetical protein
MSSWCLMKKLTIKGLATCQTRDKSELIRVRSNLREGSQRNRNDRVGEPDHLSIETTKSTIMILPFYTSPSHTKITLGAFTQPYYY